MEFWRCASLVWLCSLDTPLPLKVPQITHQMLFVDLKNPINTTYINSLPPNIYQEKNLPKESTQQMPSPDGFRILHGCCVLVSKLWYFIPQRQRPRTRRLCHRLAILGPIRARKFSFTARDGRLLLGIRFFLGVGNHETRYKALVIAVDLYCLCCLYQLLLLYLKFQCFLYFFLFSQVPCLCLSQSEATWRYHFYYFEY